jgi:integrase
MGRFWLTDPQNREPTPKGEITSYAWHLQKNGRAETTILTVMQKLSTLSRKCNILDPEQVKTTLATSEQKLTSKQNIASIYGKFLEYKGLTWQAPTYTIESSIPFIPMEKEIDALIASMSKTISAFLQLMKETGARGIEAHKTKWIDLDPERKTIYIRAAKGCNSRLLPASTKLIDMLNNLPKETEKIFNGKLKALRKNYMRQRKYQAQKQGNPRLLQIHFHTLRHWKGTTEYHKTKDVVHVKNILGHKDIESTMLYINIENSLYLPENSEYYSAAATTVQEARTLIDTGFEYVQTVENTHLYRKRK